jgi:phosphatidylglycerophosphate synthase
MEQPADNSEKIAIILAPDDKGIQPVFGIPAVRRLALLNLQLGLREVHIIGKVEVLRPILSDLVPPERFHPAGDSISLAQALEGLSLADQQEVLVSKSNHIIDRASLGRLIDAETSSDFYCYMEPNGNKGTERLYLTTPPYLVSLLLQLWSSSSNLALSGKGQLVTAVDGLPYVLDGGKEQREIGEARLMEAQAFQTRGEDGFLARHLNRRVSRFISRRLVFTPATPNQITLAGASIGMAGAFLLSLAGYWPKLLGSLLFLFCIIVDGVDGEIARLKLQATSFGHYLDIVTDNIVHIAIFAGITLGLYRDSANPAYFWILGFLIGGFGLCGLAVYQCILRRSPEELRQSPKTIRLMALLSNRDFAYLVVALALIQRLQWFLLGAAAGTYLFAGTLWIMSFRERRRAVQ